MKMSCTTRNSRFLRAFSTWWRSGSEIIGFSPMMYMHLSSPGLSASTSIMTVTSYPFLGSAIPSGKPHASENFLCAASSMTFWYAVNTTGSAPMSQAPCTLFWPRSALTPAPGLPRFPVSIWMFATDLTLSTPVVCCVIPIE
ncbi:MAG: hypothetical protein A4E37_00887 [Methanoregulaceae archaeon PtaB.Bin056]|nr:MAG: hypothetical protein A4E37_01956 [Methanoregulaceae archaeon PtaB.Bin056]OPX68684.1 MAG: hypothetical protein A4E37_00887 [Methanoregulaceae archaeon PtaB.Bin056]